MPEKNKTKIGLIGAGYWGKNLVRVFNQLGVLKTVCDSDKEILKERKEQYPKIKITDDFSAILNDKEIKGVVISTPAATHYRLARRAMLAGKDVFIEKPLALKVKDGEKLVKLARERNLILMVGHLLHYHPAMVKLKEIIKRGELGEIKYVWSNRLNFGKLRRVENVLWSFAPHDISVIIGFLGMPKRVRVAGKSYFKKNISDTTLTFLEFDNKKTAHIFGSWLNPFKEQKFVVIGSKKMAVFDGVNNELIIYPYKIKNHLDKDPIAIKNKQELINFPSKEPLIEEAEHFLKCIRKREIPKTDGIEGLNVLKVLDACQKSLLKNNKIQKI